MPLRATAVARVRQRCYRKRLMAIYCSKDGTEHPEDANFCMKCGASLRGSVTPAAVQVPMRWEYKVLVTRKLGGSFSKKF